MHLVSDKLMRIISGLNYFQRTVTVFVLADHILDRISIPPKKTCERPLLGKNNFLMREMKFDKLEICELLQGKRRKRIESLKMEHILV